jgi:hypothetical protein
LLVAAMDMFRHALAMPELERWRIHAGTFHCFGLVSAGDILT